MDKPKRVSWFRRKSVVAEPQPKKEEDVTARRRSSNVILPKINLNVLTEHKVSLPLCEDDEESSQSNSGSGSSTATPKSGSGGRLKVLRNGSGGGKSPLRITIDPIMPHASIQNTAPVGVRFDKKIRQGPQVDDGHGHVFMTRQMNDCGGDLYCEVGCSVEKMLPLSPSTSVFKETQWWPVSKRRYAQRLIFLLLDTMRVNRYVVGKDERTGNDMFVSINKNTRAVVKDRVWSFYQMSVSEKTPSLLSTRPVCKNWFVVTAEVATVIIDQVVKAINSTY